MRVVRSIALIITACGGSATDPATGPGDQSAPIATTRSSDGSPSAGSMTGVPSAGPLAAPDRRCLPVVATQCGCVYTCGSGVIDGDHWTVTHAFWNGTALRAKIEPWCVDSKCTDVFAAEIVCGGICAPKPADATCHFDPSGACVSTGG